MKFVAWGLVLLISWAVLTAAIWPLPLVRYAMAMAAAMGAAIAAIAMVAMTEE